MLAAPEPPLSDGVVTLRPWNEEDIPALVECIDGDEEIARWLDMVPQPYRDSEAQAWVELATTFWREGTAAPFAVIDAGTSRLVGSMGFRWADVEQRIGEVGYWLRREARGAGLMTRAVRLVSRWALDELGCERLQLQADERNVPSQRVAEKAGFRKEGVLRSVHFNPREKRRVDHVMYSLLPED
jgi:RimJ/RimL family protein N-acetyltransferase